MVAIVTTMAAKLFRKLSPKTVAFTAIGLTIILCVYYASYTTDVNQRTSQQEQQQQQQDNSKVIDDNSIDNNNNNNNYGVNDELRQSRFSKLVSNNNSNYRTFTRKDYEICPKLGNAEADVNTVEVFKDFDFQPPWMKTREYWDKSFEDRYERQKMDAERPPLKVIIIPHSHNDPGWLKTFENYYHYASRQIINLMVSKLQQHKNFTFIWSEMAFLNAWWEEAHPSKQRALKNLINTGQVEITTGGWVMTDEANAHIYAMVDQLIEGHQWMWMNLGVKPRSGWSVDPFGHGSTQPYLLALSGINGTVIQRIHYAWKQWLAMKQYGDFRWIPSWSPYDQQSTILTHNQPFDIYSIKHSCGPHPYICLNFDFRKVQGEYTEYSIKAQTITEKNIKEKSELLLEQYSRTGSLFPHNVVLMPLGDDFRYNVMEEWDQQYTNYIKLIDYINQNRDKYKTEIMFGTPKDYFNEIVKRYDQFPTLKGDFFVYSDIFSEGRPAYWSGYFTTRPFMKILNRELENTLRSTEILYTLALNYVRQQKLTTHLKILERDYEKLIKSRRNLGLFQHHDAITGTSKSFVMRDYGLKLFESIRDTVNVQKDTIQSLLLPKLTIKSDENILLTDYERNAFEQLPKKLPINLSKEQSRKIVVYNSLAQPQEELIKIRVNTNHVKVIDDDDNSEILSQINPVWDSNGTNTKLTIAKDEYELIFVIKLKQLTIKVLTIMYDDSGDGKLSTIYCNKCQRRYLDTTTDRDDNNIDHDILESKFQIKNIPIGDIQLENDKFKLLFNGNSGFLKTITRKIKPKIMQCGIQFAAYRSAQFHSGSYLFMPDPNEHDIEKDVLQQYKEQMSIIITSGQISSELTVIYGQFLVHSITIYHQSNSQLTNGIYIENIVDFESPPKNRETELFMRFITDIQNGEPPEFYTDLNGFQIQKRIKVDKIGIEGNYFPITTMAFLQDDQIRLSLLTNHAQGAASWQPGYLEVMIDRRTLYDDSRGMGEGVVDNRKTIHKHWLIIEDIDNSDGENGKKEQAKRFENSDDNQPFEKGEVLRSINLPTDPIINNNNNNNNNKNEVFPLPSLYATQLSNILNYPMFTYIVDQKYQNLVKNRSIHLLNEQLPCDLHVLTLRTQPDWIYSQFPSNSALLVLHRQNYDCAVNKQFQCNLKQLRKNSKFSYVKISNIEMKTLTGIETISYNLSSLSDIYVEPMTLKTFNITFVL